MTFDHPSLQILNQPVLRRGRYSCSGYAVVVLDTGATEGGETCIGNLITLGSLF